MYAVLSEGDSEDTLKGMHMAFAGGGASARDRLLESTSRIVGYLYDGAR